MTKNTNLSTKRSEHFPKFITKSSWTILLILLLSSFSIEGIGQTVIRGLALDENNERLGFANVLLRQEADSTMVKGAVSREDGFFIFENISTGKYFIELSILGYTSTYSAPFLFNGEQTMDIGELKIGDIGTALEEVEIIARRPLFEQKIDHLVVNIQNSITSAGTNALEALERSPGVNVNQQSSTLSLNGKSGVLIMINGKASRLPTAASMEMLQGMDADNIERIEIYAIPPANFDAEGDAGLINIILKKNTDYGFNGSVSGNMAYGRRPKYGASLNLNFRQEKINLYGSYSGRYSLSDQDFSYFRKVNYNNILTETTTENNRRPESLYNNIRLGLDYDLSQKTIIGLLFVTYKSDRKIQNKNKAAFVENTVPISFTELDFSETDEWKHWMGNFNIQHRFNEDESLSLDLDYLSYKNHNPSEYKNVFFDGQQIQIKEQTLQISKESPLHLSVGKMDYQKKWTDKISFEAGIKGTASRFSNDVLVEEWIQNSWTAQDQFTQDYSLKENIGAAYTAFKLILDEKTNLNIGLRYEYTEVELSNLNQPTIKQNYGNFFPTAFLSKELNEQNRVQLSFNRRISRPSFTQLAPFVTFVDPKTLYIGNPNLQPAISSNIKFDYKHKKILFSLSYGHVKNGIFGWQPRIDPETNTQFYTTENIDQSDYYDLSISMPIYPNNWWEIQNSITAGYEKNTIENEKQKASFTQRTLSAKSTHTFTLPKKFFLEIAARYQSPSYYGLLQVQRKGYLNIGLQKKLPNNQGKLNFSISDIFQTNIWRSKTVLPTLNLDNSSRFAVETRVARLSYSRTFGSSKVKKARRRSGASAAEQRRTR